ncbi:MAG: ACT domain-containing protein [Gammaproteobacteria bacterium]
MEQLMVISAVGGDRTGVVQDLTRIILDCGGSIRESRMTGLGAEFAMLLLVSGNWHTVSRMEQNLAKFGELNGLTIQLKRTEPKKFGKKLLPYAIDVVCLDEPGIVHHLAGFFAERNIEIGEVTTRSYPAAHTGTAMFSVQMFINIPAGLHISGLREEFMEFCDQLNLDAILEPVKNS